MLDRYINKTFMAICMFAFMLISCLKDLNDKEIYSYYCREADLHFSTIYGDTSVIVFEGGDSLFNMLGTNGNNCGLVLGISKETDTIYVLKSFDGPLPKVVERHHHIKFTEPRYNAEKHCEDYTHWGKCWKIEGNCDRGSYLFRLSDLETDKIICNLGIE